MTKVTQQHKQCSCAHQDY